MEKKDKEITPPIGIVKVAEGDEELHSSYTDFTKNISVNPNDFFNHQNRGLIEQVRAMDDTDLYLFGLTTTRILAILSLKREIIGEGPETDFIREVFSRIPNFYNKFFQVLSGMKCGFSVAELVWTPFDWNGSQKWGIDLKIRHQDKFAFDKKGKLRIFTQEKPEGIPTHPHKFAVFTFMEEYENHYGAGLYKKAYWYWYFKKHSVQFWASFVESFGNQIPVITGGDLGPAGETKLEDFLKNVRNRTGLRVPEGVVIDTLIKAGQQQGSINSYESFCAFLDKNMAIGFLGQTLSSDTTGTGSYALGKVHQRVRYDILLSDIYAAETFWNDQPIRWLIDYNFGTGNYPKLRVDKGKAIDKKEFAEVIDILIKNGAKIPEKWIHETFGIPQPDIDDKGVMEPILTAPAKPEPAQEPFSQMMVNAEKIKYIEELKLLGG